MNSSLDISKIVAGISFILGTLLLVLFLFFRELESIVIYGLYYVIIAFTINTFIIFWLIIKFLIRPKKQEELLKSIGVILINIPIAIGYFFIVINTF